MPVKYGSYRTATDKSKIKFASSEDQMAFNTSQVLAAAGDTNSSVNLRFENPGTGKNLKTYMNESGPGDNGPVGME